MPERRVVWSLVRALFVWAAEHQLFEILLRVSMHFNHLDWLVALASFGARTAALSPRREASAAVGSVTVAALHWVYDNHRADGATEELRLLSHFLTFSVEVSDVKVRLQGQVSLVWR